MCCAVFTANFVSLYTHYPSLLSSNQGDECRVLVVAFPIACCAMLFIIRPMNKSNGSQPTSITSILNTDEARRVHVPGAHNVRHVGGYQTCNGRLTRPDAFFRADSLHRLDTAAQQLLLARGVRTVIDLRDRSEQQEQPNPLAAATQVDYRFMPLYMHWSDLVGEVTGMVGIQEYYEMMLAACGEALADAFVVMAQPQAFPVLIHCAAGKDRTGLVTAMMLDLAGVPAEVIAADYSLSYDYLQPVMAEFLEKGAADGFDPVAYEEIMLSPAPVMCQTLAHLRDNYGGARAYLRRRGLSEQQLDNLVAQMLC